MPEELSLTKWLDPALDYFAKQSGIPIADYSAQVGGEGIGVAIEAIADIFTKGWMNLLVQGITGIASTGYAIWGKDVPTRLRKELLAMGMHSLLRVADVQTLTEISSSAQAAVAAAQRGDLNGFLATAFRTPTELKAKLEAMGVPVPSQAPPVTVPPVTPPVTAPPATPPVTAPKAAPVF